MKSYSVLSPRNLSEAFLLYGIIGISGIVWGTLYGILRVIGIDHWTLTVFIVSCGIACGFYFAVKLENRHHKTAQKVNQELFLVTGPKNFSQSLVELSLFEKRIDVLQNIYTNQKISIVSTQDEYALTNC